MWHPLLSNTNKYEYQYTTLLIPNTGLPLRIGKIAQLSVIEGNYPEVESRLELINLTLHSNTDLPVDYEQAQNGYNQKTIKTKYDNSIFYANLNYCLRQYPERHS